jgi:predicted nicotinamide N-methyase
LLGAINGIAERSCSACQRDKKVEAIKKNAASKVAELMAEEICKHEITKYHGDPSGGSDSSEQCLICGDWIYEKSARFT